MRDETKPTGKAWDLALMEAKREVVREASAWAAYSEKSGMAPFEGHPLYGPLYAAVAKYREVIRAY